MFGKLSFSSIPYHDPIIATTIIIITFIGLLILTTVTYLEKWGYLWKEWITSVDHKKIGIMYIITSVVMLIRGFTDAIMMRLHQAMVSSGAEGFLSAHHYNQIITAHGVIMIIFMATPFIIGLMNIIVPLQIGSRDVAFPFLNSLSFWLFFGGVVLMNISLGVGEFAQTGWTAYPPLSNKTYSPGVGVDYWIWSIQISGIGTTLTGINLITTILRMRAPGMTKMRMPVFTWTALCTNILIVFAFPILTSTIMLLTLDRYLGTHFFTNDMGGNAMMYVNLFWAWGHPEVYILILPAFGIFSEIVSTFSRKYLFGYTSLVWATVSITVLSFCVWLHHFFTMGAEANVNAFFGIMTMIIAIPTGVKIFNWLFTIYQGRIMFNLAMLWTIGFLVTFPIGGMAGVLLAIPGVDFVLHNSLFLVAHFHNVIISGVLFGCFAGINYWFPKIFGYVLNEKWGKRAFWLWIIGFYIAFIPLYVLGFMGMTRRLNQSIDVAFHPLLSVSLVGTIIILFGILCQIIQVLVSIFYRRDNLDLTGDPWNGRTLEWSIPSPPPFYNFSIIPKVDCRDAFWKMKKEKIINKHQKKYESIYMTKNTGTGVIVAMFSLITSFALIWYIWWLVVIGCIGVIVTLLNYAFKKDTGYLITAKKIESFEDTVSR